MIQQRQPIFTLPGLIWKFLKWISPLIFAYVAFVLIAGFGYWLVVFILAGWPNPLTLLVCMLPGFLYAPIWVLATRKKTRAWRTLVLPPVITAMIVFVLVLGLHWARPGPTQFDFLSGKGMTFHMMAPAPGYFEWAYTFAGDFDKVAVLAETELRAKGYTVDRKRGRFYASKGQEGGLETLGLSIYPERAMGKRFWIDSDFLEFDSTPGWVTVDLVEQDVYPTWLSEFIP